MSRNSTFRALLFLPYFATLVAVVLSESGAEPISVVVEVLDEEGGPVEGAEVVCYREIGWNTLGSQSMSEITRGITNSNGRVQLQPSGGTYFLLKATDGELGAWSRVTVEAWPRNETRQQKLVLKASDGVEGTIRDEAQRPLAGVTVTFDRRFTIAVTDEAGQFRLPGVKRRDYSSVAFYKEGYAWQVVYDRASRRNVTMVRGTILDMFATDPSGNVLSPEDIEFKLMGSIVEPDQEGRIRTITLTPGKKIGVSADRETGSAHWSGKGVVKVTDGPIQEIVIPLEKIADVHASASESPDSAPIVERLDERYVSGKAVLDETGEPVPGNVILLDSLEHMTSYYLSILSQYSTDPSSAMEDFRPTDTPQWRNETDGSFKFDLGQARNLQSGIQYILLVPDDPLLYAVEGIVEVDLRNGPVEDLLLTAKPGGAVRGRVVDAEGYSLTRHARVHIFIEGGLGFGRSAYTNPAGVFSIVNLPPMTHSFGVGLSRAEPTYSALGPGEFIDDILIRVEGNEGSLSVVGTIVDESGAAMPGVGISIRSENSDGEVPRFDWAKSDSHGRFISHSRVKKSSRVHVTASIGQPPVKIGGKRFYFSKPVEIIEGGILEIDAEQKMQVVQLVGKLGTGRYIRGTIIDESGNPLDAEVSVLSSTEGVTPVYGSHDGHFVERALPQESVALEFVRAGFKPVILEEGRHFIGGDLNIEVIMEAGPFGFDESVWTTTTGLPDSEEAVAAMVMGEEVNSRKLLYRYVAGLPRNDSEESEMNGRAVPSPTTGQTMIAPPEPASDGTPPQNRSSIRQPSPQAERVRERWPYSRREEKISIAVVDAVGEPVKRILAQEARTYENGPMFTMRHYNVVPTGQTIRQLSNERGEYGVPNGWLIKAKGTGRALVYVPADARGQEPVHQEGPLPIQLFPAASVTIQVVDDEGLPLPGVHVGPAQELHRDARFIIESLPRTDSNGCVRFDELLPGDYQFQAMTRKWADTTRAWIPPVSEIVYIHVESETDTRFQIVHALPKAGSTEGIFRTLEQAFNTQKLKDGDFDRLDVDTKTDLSRLTVDRIEKIPYLAMTNIREFGFLSTAAGLLNIDAAVPRLKRFLLSFGDPDSPFGMSEYAVIPRRILPTIEAIASLERDRAVDFFVEFVKNERMAPGLRIQGIIALGQIATPHSAMAYAGLRDAQFEAPGAPTERDEYTHTQRIMEAIEMTFRHIPDTQKQFSFRPGSIVVDDGYRTGSARVDFGNAGISKVYLRRVRLEWLVSGIGETMFID